jgi:death on curing protein
VSAANQPWRWVNRDALLLLHRESLAEHGGAEGIRDEGLLDSALARPLNLVAYAPQDAVPDLAAIAACYGVGLAKNHPFIDGNKRAAFLSVGLFLYANGQRLVATQADATLTMLAVAAGDLSEDAFAQWLRERIAARAP